MSQLIPLADRISVHVDDVVSVGRMDTPEGEVVLVGLSDGEVCRVTGRPFASVIACVHGALQNRRRHRRTVEQSEAVRHAEDRPPTSWEP